MTKPYHVRLFEIVILSVAKNDKGKTLGMTRGKCPEWQGEKVVPYVLDVNQEFERDSAGLLVRWFSE
jgi:hypothetical protein